MSAYFVPNTHAPGYVELRTGEYRHELGEVDGRYAPEGSVDGSAGAIVHCHVDDLPKSLEDLLVM